MYADAVATFQEMNKVAPDNLNGLASLGRAYALAGKTDAAQKILAQLKERSAQHYVSPHQVAMIYAGLGDKEQTLSWLEKACQQRANRLIFLRVDPQLDGLRSDRRFATLVKRLAKSIA
jgi:tetratricopeptide (TPR) repeat protein